MTFSFQVCKAAPMQPLKFEFWKKFVSQARNERCEAKSSGRKLDCLQ
jgi:hypothetical protein